jgi:hypothetical protein
VTEIHQSIKTETSMHQSMNIIAYVEEVPNAIVPIWYTYESNLSEGHCYEYKGKYMSEKVNKL